MKKSYLLLIGALFLSLAVNPANAQVIYESFNYTSAANLEGQNGGTGFSAAWATPGIKITATITTGLTFGSLATSGNAALVTNGIGGAGDAGWGVNNLITRAITTPLVGTYWQSNLINISNRGADENFLAVGSGIADGTTINAVSPVGYNYTTGAIRTQTNDGSFGATNAVTDGSTTYLMLAKYTGTETTAWMLTLANYNAWVTAGSTEAALTLNSFNTGSRTGDAAFVGGILMGGYAYAGATVAVVDEIRFGGTLADVTTVPEPSTYALLAFGLGALIFLRRRRSA